MMLTGWPAADGYEEDLDDSEPETFGAGIFLPGDLGYFEVDFGDLHSVDFEGIHNHDEEEEE